ncbi:LADA_0E13432g1_1 [Lachancea dasiensis]|uniref:LADA_0E13432g1_1 n=1 Tax=Lachancea dasiensis TaxID=1072105 RepID=A0A1G4JFX3_9SACH|nr:LADA_0E13432g1_1 [Lachancea dasiensis]
MPHLPWPSVGDRLCVEGQFCTIRFVGEIPQWKSEKAYGLEWDNITRGKHSGVVGGVRYFETKFRTSGSIVKESKVIEAIHRRCTFIDSLSNVYLSKAGKHRDVYFGSKRVEMTGLDVLDLRNGDVSSLKCINLSYRNIAAMGDLSKLRLLAPTLKSLKQLNLSHNLLTDISQVISLIGGIKSLRSLDISGNKFTEFKIGEGDRVWSVTELSANCCELSAENIEKLCYVFPALQTLQLDGNGRSASIVLSQNLLPDLSELSLANNYLEEFPQHCEKSAVTSLNLSYNPISRISLKRATKIRTLAMSNCELNTWSSIDAICITFPELTNLKINDNPINTKGSSDDAYLQTIGRIRKLLYLDGTFIAEKEKQDAEIYLMTLVSKSQAPINELGEQWRYLTNKHGKISRKPSSNIMGSGLATLNLSIYFEGRKIREIEVLPCYSVRYLKSIISKLVTLSIFDFELSRISSDGVEHEFNFEFSPISTFSVKNNDVISVLRTGR